MAKVRNQECKRLLCKGKESVWWCVVSRDA